MLELIGYWFNVSVIVVLFSIIPFAIIRKLARNETVQVLC